MNAEELIILDTLRGQSKDGIISPEGATFLASLMKKNLNEIKKELEERHKYAIRKKTIPYKGVPTEYYFTRVKDNGIIRDITAIDEYNFYRKLWDHYHDSIDISNKTIANLYTRYIMDRRNDSSITSQTVDADESTYRKYLKDSEFEKHQITNIKACDVLKFYKEITGTGEVVTAKAFSKLRTLMNGIFDYAIDKGIINENPARAVPIRRLKFKPARDNSEEVYTDEERNKLLVYLRSLPVQTTYSLAIQLSACFCMRIGELRALTWDDYNAAKKKIFVHHSIAQRKVDGRRVDKDLPHTKNHLAQGNRWVPVSAEAARILEELRLINGNKQYILQGGGSAKFSISANHFNDHLKKYCQEAGIRYLSSHKFRFYGITALYDAGVDEHVIQYIAGHASADMTRRYRRSQTTEVADNVIEAIFG